MDTPSSLHVARNSASTDGFGAARALCGASDKVPIVGQREPTIKDAATHPTFGCRRTPGFCTSRKPVVGAGHGAKGSKTTGGQHEARALAALARIVAISRAENGTSTTSCSDIKDVWRGV